MKTTTTTTKNNYRFFIILALVLFSCALIISSVWDTSKSLTKTAWEFLIFLPSFLLANAGKIINSNAGRGMIGLFILYVLIKIYTRPRKKNEEEPEATPAPKQEPQVILIKPVGYPVEMPSGVETIEYYPAPLPQTAKKINKKGVKKYHRVYKKHEHIWRIIKPTVETGGSLDAMRDALKKKFSKPVSDNTLRAIIKKFEK